MGCPRVIEGELGTARAAGSQPASVRLIVGCHATLLWLGMLRQPEHSKARQSPALGEVVLQWCSTWSSSKVCTVLRWRLIACLATAGKPHLAPSPPLPHCSSPLHPGKCCTDHVPHSSCPTRVSPPAQSSRGLVLQPRAEVLVVSHRLDPLARSLCPSRAEQMKTPARLRGESKPSTGL